MAEEETTEEVTEPTVETTEEPTVEATTESDDWRSSIKDEGARDFAKTFSSGAGAAEAAYKFRQQLSKGIEVPGDDADEDAIKDFRNKLGVPSEAKGYELKAPDGLSDELKEQVYDSEEGQQVLNKFREIAHNNNVSPKALQEIVSEYMTLSAQGQETNVAESKKALEAAEDSLGREWGKDKEANENYGRDATKSFGDESFNELLENQIVDGLQLGNHPAMRRMLANVGRSVGEDGFQVAPSEGESAGMNDELSNLYDLMNTDMSKYSSSATQNRIQTLEGRLNGDTPLVGSQGRSA